MKMNASLDDLVLFALVASEGGLSGAARHSGVSMPTLSRRMRALEQTFGWPLFQRGKQGYQLTAQGRSLALEAASLTAFQERIGRLSNVDRPVDVRITAGGWTAGFVARHLGRVWSSAAPWRPAFLEAEAQIDIARRGADIGIRNRRPEQSWLAGRKTAVITYAVYARDPSVEGYLSLSGGAVKTPSAEWLQRSHGDEVVATASTPRLLLDMACAGMGRVVLPRFAAAPHESLQQIGDVIDALTHEEWLVSHHDARNDPPVRAALDAIAEVLCDAALRSGGEPGAAPVALGKAQSETAQRSVATAGRGTKSLKNLFLLAAMHIRTRAHADGDKNGRRSFQQLHERSRRTGPVWYLWWPLCQRDANAADPQPRRGI